MEKPYEVLGAILKANKQIRVPRLGVAHSLRLAVIAQEAILLAEPCYFSSQRDDLYGQRRDCLGVLGEPPAES